MQKKVTISDYFFEDNSFQLSDFSLTSKDLIDTHNLITSTIILQFRIQQLVPPDQ